MSEEFDNVTFLKFGGKDVSDQPEADVEVMQMFETNKTIVDANEECERISRGLLIALSAAMDERLGQLSDPEEFRKCMAAISVCIYGTLMQQKRVHCAEVDVIQSIVSMLEQGAEQ